MRKPVNIFLPNHKKKISLLSPFHDFLHLLSSFLKEGPKKSGAKVEMQIKRATNPYFRINCITTILSNEKKKTQVDRNYGPGKEPCASQCARSLVPDTVT